MSPHASDAAGTHWSPAHYARFSNHRTRPAVELLQRIPIDQPKLIYDLGCGTGEITSLICERWPSARLIGMDVSAQMLDKARQRSIDVEWQLADIATWTAEAEVNLIFANAALHWLPDHQQLLPRLFGYLSSRGVLAIQMPLSWDLPSHQLMRETLRDLGSAGFPLGGQTLSGSLATNWVESAECYYDILADLTIHVDIWETMYWQVLNGQDAVYNWVEATGLRPVLNGLSDSEKKLFLPEYLVRLRRAYPVRPDGSVIYPFKRLFIIAQAGGDESAATRGPV
jgi:trans-aconitate 2-methyltransferase